MDVAYNFMITPLIQGPAGPAGPTGRDGARGVPGRDGSPGDRGPDGTPVSSTVLFHVVLSTTTTNRELVVCQAHKVPTDPMVMTAKLEAMDHQVNPVLLDERETLVPLVTPDNL